MQVHDIMGLAVYALIVALNMHGQSFNGDKWFVLKSEYNLLPRFMLTKAGYLCDVKIEAGSGTFFPFSLKLGKLFL